MIKKWHVVLGLLILFIDLIYLFISSIPDFKPDYAVTPINFAHGQKLYFKSKTWGISANHEGIELSISAGANKSADSVHNYVFIGLSPIFYKASNDTLWLFIDNKANTPRFFNSNITIIQTELENTPMMNLYKDYKMGLKKFD